MSLCNDYGLKAVISGLLPPLREANRGLTRRRAFPIIVPDLWKGFPEEERGALSMDIFKKHCKPHLFFSAFKNGRKAGIF